MHACNACTVCMYVCVYVCLVYVMYCDMVYVYMYMNVCMCEPGMYDVCKFYMYNIYI